MPQGPGARRRGCSLWRRWPGCMTFHRDCDSLRCPLGAARQARGWGEEAAERPPCPLRPSPAIRAFGLSPFTVSAFMELPSRRFPTCPSLTSPPAFALCHLRLRVRPPHPTSLYAPHLLGWVSLTMLRLSIHLSVRTSLPPPRPRPQS